MAKNQEFKLQNYQKKKKNSKEILNFLATYRRQAHRMMHAVPKGGFL